MRRMIVVLSALCALAVSIAAQQSQETVRPIEPPSVGLPSEQVSANVRKFSFFAYGDTRGQVDGQELQPEHGRVIDAMLKALKPQEEAGFPVRFVIQSGDAVTSGGVVAQWNLRFTSLIERLTRDGDLPFFFAVGNHDAAGSPVNSPERLRLRNTFTAMSKLWPPEGSRRRLDGYATFAFGYGQFFFIALDSNIASDQTQLTWVTEQLASLDRVRHPYVVVYFHHPPITSGPHGGPTVVESQTTAIRRLYLPLFRRHHVRMTITGHDHLFDHWVEYYDDADGTHRMDHVVSGGGGAPTYVYQGEPDVQLYAASAAPQRVRVEHLAKPGDTLPENPHHFMIFEVDGDRLWARAVGTGSTPYHPYGAPRIELSETR